VSYPSTVSSTREKPQSSATTMSPNDRTGTMEPIVTRSRAWMSGDHFAGEDAAQRDGGRGDEGTLGDPLSRA
jgi:hypothetical protein